ncbi:MAG: hypothetical protein ABJA60_11275 [Nitrosospira sp.]
MKTWTDWEIMRHHVSICGRVVNKEGKPMSGVQLSVAPGATPSEPRVANARRGSAKVRPVASEVLKQTESRLDGMFFFLDCPDGKYTLRAIDLQSGAQAEQTVSAAGSAMKRRAKERKPEEGYQIELVI